MNLLLLDLQPGSGIIKIWPIRDDRHPQYAVIEIKRAVHIRNNETGMLYTAYFKHV